LRLVGHFRKLYHDAWNLEYQVHNLHGFLFFPALPVNIWHKGDANCCLCTVVPDVHVVYRIHNERRCKYNPSMLNAKQGRHALKLSTEDDHYDDDNDDDDDDDDNQRRRQKFEDV